MTIPLPAEAVRHLTRSLRLGEGDPVVAFDDEGRTAPATLKRDGDAWLATLDDAPTAAEALPELTVCCAVPKGPRADWLAEKLGELGVTRLVPLLTKHGVVDPGQGKVDRWRRLAAQAARQSRSPGVLEITEPLDVATALTELGSGVVLTTERPAAGLGQASIVYIGPEGGWTEAELAQFDDAGCSFATLGVTVLRVETAAVAAAAVLRCGATMP